MAKNSKAKIAANARYSAKAYDRIALTVHKGSREDIKSHADAFGKSLNGFINEAIAEKMERDKTNLIRNYKGYEIIPMNSVEITPNTDIVTVVRDKQLQKTAQ